MPEPNDPFDYARGKQMTIDHHDNIMPNDHPITSSLMTTIINIFRAATSSTPFSSHH